MMMSEDDRPEWFWGDISRMQANELLQGAPDGAFLVRNSSSNPNDLTLTVKKNGSNKMMRIVCRNGLFGFREPLQYRSLRALIEVHRLQPLLEYNQEMDVRLEYPISRQLVLRELPAAATEAATALFVDATSSTSAAASKGAVESPPLEKLMEMLVKANEDYLMVTHDYDKMYDNYNKSLNDVQTYKQAIESFNELIAILDEHIRVNETYQAEAMEHEVSLMVKHKQAIINKLKQVKEERTSVDEELKKATQQSRSMDRQLNELKPQIHEHKRSREQLSALLIRQGVRREMIERRLEQQQLALATAAAAASGKSDWLPSVEGTDMTENETINYTYLDTEFLNNACRALKEKKQQQKATLARIDSVSSEYKTITRLPDANQPDDGRKAEDDYLSSTAAGMHLDTDFEQGDAPCFEMPIVEQPPVPPPVPRKPLLANNQNQQQSAEGSTLAAASANSGQRAYPTDAQLEMQLESMEWYVGDASREQINDLLFGMPDGTFLLRDSKQRADAPYTLTVRKEGANKMLRMLQRQGKFGFKEPLDFDSPQDLIRYHMRQPLPVFKADLLIQLVHPWSTELHKQYRPEQ